MRHVFLAAAFTLSALPATAQGIEGLWETGTNGAKVEIAPCGDAMCGTLVSSNAIEKDADAKDVENDDKALRDRPLKGLTMLSGFSGGPKKWTGGKLYNPADGKTYSGTITLTGPDTLKLKGCVVAPLCKTREWTRIE